MASVARGRHGDALPPDKRAIVDDPQLQEAVKELLLASEGFRRAYELWERAPEHELGWERTLLDEAQLRLDAARDRVQDVEFHGRRPEARR